MQHFYEILWTVIGTIASGLATWLVVVITNWLNKKVKDEKASKVMTEVVSLIGTVVMKVSQTFVDSMKKAGKFDEEAAKAAKKAAIEEIKHQLTVEQRATIESIYADVEAWISSMVEAQVYSLSGHGFSE